jgi:hypothetical protein
MAANVSKPHLEGRTIDSSLSWLLTLDSLSSSELVRFSSRLGDGSEWLRSLGFDALGLFMSNDIPLDLLTSVDEPLANSGPVDPPVSTFSSDNS